MKISLKFLITLLAAIVLLALPAKEAKAQYLPYQVLSGGTNFIAANTLNTYGTIIPVTRGSTVALQASFKLVSSGTSGITYLFNRSVDGLIWETNVHSWTIAATGTTTNSAVTNITVSSTGYLMLNTVTNNNAVILTNNLLKAYQKAGF